MRELRVIDAGDPLVVLESLRTALAGGPAILPRPSDAAAPVDLPAQVPQRIALVVETSGSTGLPKRVALSADALLASAAAADAALGGPGQWVLALPAHYIAGLNVLTRSIAAQTDPVILSGPFEAAAFAAAVRELDARQRRYASLVPAQLQRLIEHPESHSAVRELDAIVVGGQAMPRPVLDSAAALGFRVVRSYGSSETSGGCVYDGVPLSGVAVAVVDGEVELSGPTLAEGYLGDDERTASAFVTRDGIRWYRTGDAGSLDAGVLSVTGRLDDVIISGGLKVSLGAIERAVQGHPGFETAVVVPAPDARWGEVPVLVTTRTIGDLEVLRADLGARLGPAARPARMLRLDELPMLASGKPDRVTLTALAAATDTLES
jgi:O-succinylbenzoic acid--CoA ligase